MAARPPTYYEPSVHRVPLKRIDSVINGSSWSNSGPLLNSAAVSTAFTDTAIVECQEPPLMTARKPHIKSVPLQFLIVDDPSQLRNKAQLKAVRQHVMHNYLEREGQKPSSRDIRITKATNSRGRRKAQPSSTSETHGLGMIAPIPSHQTTRSPDVYCSSSYAKAASKHAMQQETTAITNTATNLQPRSVSPVKFADDIAPIIRGIAGGFKNSRYLKASPDCIPGPAAQAYLGSNLQPFASWPTFTDTSLNIEQMKWSCSRKFGTRGISQYWVPALLQAQHAFLSTLCISASHDDIMMRAQQTPHERLLYGSTERMKVRSQVLSMINEALADPETQTKDTTLIAVLQVLNSEIMGCDDRTMRIHQNGLHDLVLQRGGLRNLGVKGQLASILTITMYLIAALRETTPHSEYANYTSQHRPASSGTTRQIPESPLFCRAGGFEAIKRSISDSSPTMRLLTLLHLSTDVFIRQNGIETSVLATSGHTSPSLAALRDQIFALPCAEALTTEFPTTHARSQYESLRLAALVYSHALASRIPLSTASAQLSRVYNRSTGTCNLASDHLRHHAVGSLGWHVLIQTALLRTNLSDCWGSMAGVLFFVTLVAGACANPAPRLDSQSEVMTMTMTMMMKGRKISAAGGEEEEGRKWLAAVTVRCSIVLSFEFGDVVLATLRRLVGIQQALGSESGGSSRQMCRGLEEKPSARFSDFALDFMSGL